MENFNRPNPWSYKPRGEFSRIASCQKRLALSASPATDVLFDLMSLSENSGNDLEGLSLWEQAAHIQGKFGADGAGQTIAVIDTGVAYDHIALGGGFGPGYRVVGGWDFAEQDHDPYDDGPAGFHGTHVAGILGGKSHDFAGIASGVDLVALRVFDDQGNGNLDWVEGALQWVIEHRNAFENPITTVNLSLGAFIPESLSVSIQTQLGDELSRLREDGILVFAAAGNLFDSAHPTRLSFPASSADVEAVGSTNASGSLSSFSQRSQGILVAPGEAVRSSVPDHVLGWDGKVDDFSRASGTSMSSPQVAAASVLLRDVASQHGLELGGSEILEYLRETAMGRSDPATGIRYLEVNLLGAIDRVLESLDLGEAEEDAEDGSLDDSVEVVPAGEAHELGELAYLERELSASVHYSLQASRTGFLSFVFPEEAEGAAEVGLFVINGEDQVLWNGPLQGRSQLDFQVVAGQRLTFSLDSAAPMPVKIVNQVSLNNGNLQILGTHGEDHAVLNLQEGTAIEINGARYDFAREVVRATEIDLGPNRDQLTIVGSEFSEKVTVRPGTGEIESSLGVVSFRNAESVQISGGGGTDRGYLFDSPGSDDLVMRPGSAILTGAGFEHDLAGFSRIFADGTAGGEDLALLFDSPGDDRLAIRHQFTSLSGEGFFLNAIGFERVQAYAGAGGRDYAALYDSPASDRMSASSVQAWISGPGYYAQARHFGEVRAFSILGGVDQATLYADQESDRWVRTGDLLQLDSSENTIRSAHGFHRSDAFYQGQSITVSSFSLDLAEAGRRPEVEGSQASERRIEELLRVQDRKASPVFYPLMLETRQSEKTVLQEVLAEAESRDPIEQFLSAIRWPH